jgi:hypothetical protein
MEKEPVKTLKLAETILTPGLALALGVSFLVCPVLATPYATCLTNNAGIISFRLNEAADTVKITWNGGASGHDLGARGKGLTVADLSAPGVTSPFKVEVTKMAGPGYLQGVVNQLSVDTNTSVQFANPRGLAINQNPASPYFGRVYVAVATAATTGSGRTVDQGIYVLNADQSDALGQGNTALTGGLSWDPNATSGSEGPYRLTVGPDDHLYIADWSDNTGCLYVTDPDVAANSSATNVFEGIGGPSATPFNHGSVYASHIEGSLAGGTLTIYTGDEDLAPASSVWRYDIGAQPLPYIGTPTFVFSAGNLLSQVADLARHPNGIWYKSQRRATPSNPGGQSIAGGSGIFVMSADGATQLWASLQATRDREPENPNVVDALIETRGIALSPDGKYLAAIRGDNNSVRILPLVDGVPNLSGMVTMATAPTTSIGRELTFDAAGNLYTVSSGQQLLRVYSPGGRTKATTGSDGTFALLSPPDVTVTSDLATIAEGGPTTATLTITRATTALAAPLPVTFSMGGEAVRGTDYVLQTNNVTVSGNEVVIPAGSASVNVALVALDDAEAEFAETARLTLASGTDYAVGLPSNQAVVIVDNDPPVVDLAVVYASMYERLPADYARLSLVRRGDTNAPGFEVNLAYEGTAAAARYNAPRSVTVEPGVVTQNFDIQPVDDALLNGNQTIIARVVSGTGYTVGTTNPTATATVVDDELPAEDVIWAENFNTDVSAQWTVRFASANGLDDYRIGGLLGATTFSYDYLAATWCPSVPAAPHSKSDTLGLYLTVNKDDPTALGAAGINVYPNGRSFSGNYAVRFDMYLMVGNASSTTEYALFGLNHGGTQANWFRNSSGGVPNNPAFDGLFFGVEADGASLGDYVIYSAPTTAGNNPTALTPGVNASTLTGVFKSGPYDGYNFLPGAPGNSELTTNPSWADVEITHIGNVVTLIINRTPIMSYTNTTAFTSGNLMLGYCDAYDSIMAGASGVIYDNLRVVRLAAATPPNITRIQVVGATAEIDFTAETSDAPTGFTLQAAATVNGPYGDASATITGTAGSFQAVVALSGAQQFYRVRRN